MDEIIPNEAGEAHKAVTVERPEHYGSERGSAVVFASPHSGRRYDPAFLDLTRLNLRTLRQSEDAFVDQLFAAAPVLGAPLIKALFPRVFVDPNREPYELDATMFADPLPPWVNTTSPRVAAGLGTIPRIVATGDTIYRRKLEFRDVERRLWDNYFPFHRILQRILDQTFRKQGHYVLIDCHSMPSVAAAYDADAGRARTDFVLGDCYGTACDHQLTALVEGELRRWGYSVRRNIPYAGGYITRRYGRPREGRHVLQIEINRALYLDEPTVTLHDGFDRLSQHLEHLIRVIVDSNGLGAT